jgi:hypothetical protein
VLKKVSMAAVAALILAGAAISLSPAPAEARHGCDARADRIYPYNKHARKAYKKDCRGDYRAWKKRNNKGIWIIL